VKNEKGFVKNFTVKDIAANQCDQSFQEFEISIKWERSLRSAKV